MKKRKVGQDEILSDFKKVVHQDFSIHTTHEGLLNQARIIHTACFIAIQDTVGTFRFGSSWLLTLVNQMDILWFEYHEALNRIYLSDPERADGLFLFNLLPDEGSFIDSTQQFFQTVSETNNENLLLMQTSYRVATLIQEFLMDQQYTTSSIDQLFNKMTILYWEFAQAYVTIPNFPGPAVYPQIESERNL